MHHTHQERLKEFAIQLLSNWRIFHLYKPHSIEQDSTHVLERWNVFFFQNKHGGYIKGGQAPQHRTWVSSLILTLLYTPSQFSLYCIFPGIFVINISPKLVIVLWPIVSLAKSEISALFIERKVGQQITFKMSQKSLVKSTQWLS